MSKVARYMRSSIAVAATIVDDLALVHTLVVFRLALAYVFSLILDFTNSLTTIATDIVRKLDQLEYVLLETMSAGAVKQTISWQDLRSGGTP